MRDSRIELLRVFAMVAIVIGHFSDQAGLATLPIARNGARIAVNVFLLISCWFLVDRQFSFKRVIKTYLEIFIYSIALTVAAMAISGVASVGFRDIMQGLVPFYGRSLWYGSAYISLLLFKPFLDVLLKQSRKFQLMMGGGDHLFVRAAVHDAVFCRY